MDVRDKLLELEELAAAERDTWELFQGALRELLDLDPGAEGRERIVARVEDARARWVETTRARHAYATALSVELVQAASDNRRRRRTPRSRV